MVKAIDIYTIGLYFFALVGTALFSVDALSAQFKPAEQIVLLDPATEGIPEAIASDYWGNLYISLGQSVRKYSAKGKLLASYDLPTDGGNVNGDMVITWNGDIFVNNNGDEITEKGVWRIQQHEGIISKYADIDPSTSGFLNGITIDYYGNLYVADSQEKKIYKIDTKGNVEDWVVDPLLEGDGSTLGFSVGVNNLALDRWQQYLYASNLDQGTVLKIRIKRDGSSGKIKKVAEDPLLKGIDGITFNRRNQLFAAINKPNRIVKISGRGKVNIIEDPTVNPETLIDFPSDVVFGKGRDSFTLYVSNFSLLSQEKNPGILRIEKNKKHFYPYYKKEAL